jgi:central glycolytic genes regulator
VSGNLFLQRQIIPEGMELLERRFSLLRIIHLDQPVGRRTLAQRTGLSERTVRSETDFLKKRNFIEIIPRGMVMTKEGLKLLTGLNEFMQDFLGLDQVAEFIAKKLGFKKVIVIPGDSDESQQTLEQMGQKAAMLLAEFMRQYALIALTGGNSVKEIVEQFPQGERFPEVMVVPARGGAGRNYNIQSNTLVGRLADRMGGKYRLLNLPDMISEQALGTMLKEKEVHDTVNLIKQADVVVAGLGKATVMARRRGMSEEEVLELEALDPRGEFFGSYYNSKGKIVKNNLAVGLSLEDVKKAKEVLIIAGGSSKAEAILSIDFSNINGILITDEGAARGMMELLNHIAI